MAATAQGISSSKKYIILYLTFHTLLSGKPNNEKYTEEHWQGGGQEVRIQDKARQRDTGEPPGLLAERQSRGGHGQWHPEDERDVSETGD